MSSRVYSRGISEPKPTSLATRDSSRSTAQNDGYFSLFAGAAWPREGLRMTTTDFLYRAWLIPFERSLSRSPRPSQFCRSRSGIGALLGFGRDDRIGTDRRIQTRTYAAAKGIFYTPILAAVEADNCRHPAGRQTVRQHGEQSIQIRHLTIDQNAQRLKRPRTQDGAWRRRRAEG